MAFDMMDWKSRAEPEVGHITIIQFTLCVRGAGLTDSYNEANMLIAPRPLCLHLRLWFHPLTSQISRLRLFCLHLCLLHFFIPHFLGRNKICEAPSLQIAVRSNSEPHRLHTVHIAIYKNGQKWVIMYLKSDGGLCTLVSKVLTDSNALFKACVGAL